MSVDFQRDRVYGLRRMASNIHTNKVMLYCTLLLFWVCRIWLNGYDFNDDHSQSRRSEYGCTYWTVLDQTDHSIKLIKRHTKRLTIINIWASAQDRLWNMEFNSEDSNQKYRRVAEMTDHLKPVVNNISGKSPYIGSSIVMCNHISDISAIQLVRFKKLMFSFAARIHRVSRRQQSINCFADGSLRSSGRTHRNDWSNVSQFWERQFFQHNFDQSRQHHL